MVRTVVLCGAVAVFVIGSTAVPEPKVGAAQSCPPASVSVGSLAGYEGTGGVRTFAVPVTVSAPAGCTATGSVVFSTTNGNAVSPSDYQGVSTQVTWNGENGTKMVGVQIGGDTAIEPDEWFSVRIGSPSGVTIAQPHGVVNLLDDDAEPAFSSDLDGGKICWSIDRGTTQAQTCSIPVRTNKPARVPVTIRFRTIDPDGRPVRYLPVQSGTVTIPVGSTVGYADVQLVPGPHPVEEKFFVELYNPSAGVLGVARAEVVIRDR